MASVLRIGSRPSPLALAQAELVRHKLAALVPSVSIEIVAIRTTGDRMATAALAQVGGKGLFIKELEQALAKGRIDLAVHSMKDLPAQLTSGFRIAAVPERADPRDALLARAAASIAALPRGARLGTSSVRRRFEALRLRPDLDVVALRGNVDTRLARLAAGDFDAIILAMAGLARLERGERDAAAGGVALSPLDVLDFVPCGGQGALCIEARASRPVAGSPELEAALAALDDPHAHLEVAAERAFLAALGASCVSPVGVYATLKADTLAIRALVFRIDGARHLSDEISDQLTGGAAAAATGAPLERAAALGARLAQRMLADGAGALLADGEPAASSALALGMAGESGRAPETGARPDSLAATPLHGRCVVVTRAREAGGAFAAGLRALGAEVTEFPAIEIVAPDSYAAIDAALARVALFDWMLFTSASGVERMLERMKTRGVDRSALDSAKLGAIGPATAARLAAHGLTVAAMPREYRAEAIVEAISAERIRGARILIPRAQVAREVLPEMLTAAGAREVVVAPVYKTVKPANAPVERVRAMAAAGTIDLVAFTSSSTVTNFCEMLGAAGARGLKAAAIGPITAETARAAGLEVVVQPSEYTTPALIAAIHNYFVSSDK
ncbi:MAG TPA: hydroxymethylbilane synthase [Candidatus Binataceae bacterium]|nr:hydroxymethylbilane synthase [Candidatus Binataceae bacterium]